MISELTSSSSLLDEPASEPCITLSRSNSNINERMEEEFGLSLSQAKIFHVQILRGDQIEPTLLSAWVDRDWDKSFTTEGLIV